jgi:lipoprotein NlpD
MRWRALPVVLLAALLGACAPNMAPVYTRTGQLATSHYVVRTGDTLYSISWRHGLDYRAVARWNRIGPPYTIHPGQRLRLAAPPQATPPAGSAAAKPAVVRPERTRPTPSASQSAAPAALGWRWPVEGRLSRRFAEDAQGKQGIALSGSLGQSVTAAAGGRVVYAGNGLRGYGNLVIVKHNGRYLTAYGYNREILVQEGDVVTAGQRIATMGMGPGQQPALHFELRRDGKPVDPLPYLPENK